MAIQTERLNRLAGLLDAYRHNPGKTEFDLSGWSTRKTRRGGFLWMQAVECGTAACAVGLACLSGEFSHDGLSAVKYQDGTILPIYGEASNWDAVQGFFGLSQRQALYLFDENSYDVRQGQLAAAAVAARIRALVGRSERSKRASKPRRTTAAVEKIKLEALEAVI